MSTLGRMESAKRVQGIGGTRRAPRYSKAVSVEPVPQAKIDAAEDVLARLIAFAYAAEHPVLFEVAPATTTPFDASPATQPGIMALPPDTGKDD